MIPPNASPVDHVPPLPRIDLSPKREGAGCDSSPASPCTPEESERIWQAVVATARGTNTQAIPADYVAPDEDAT